MSLSPQGIVSGTPAAEGISKFTVAVKDAANTAATAAGSITVTAAPPVLFTGTYPPATHATYTAPALTRA